jgi:hypothetical protein
MSERYDSDFYEVIYDTDGNPKTQLKQQIAKRVKEDSCFTIFDSSHGHCGLCGSLSCNGGCFK